MFTKLLFIRHLKTDILLLSDDPIKRLSYYLNGKYQAVATHTQRQWLRLKNTVLRRPLHLESLTLGDSVVIEGCEVDILWQVRGCHSIEIAGLGIFSGNVRGIRLRATAERRVLHCTFYGRVAPIYRTLDLAPTRIEVLHTFDTQAALPLAVGMQQHEPILTHQLTTEPVLIGINHTTDLTMLFEPNIGVGMCELTIELEAFELTHYPLTK